ncbi:MAG TPA: hypothetical protein PKL65_10440 [Bacteroidales bacterium]|jgi:hypothetical protein|nr:hypothetical protein [Bacteroidales bacterium]HNR42638.1 hypothetical protein [Bacteroidales bacterium]HQG78023.1 hypothetical protein [Bacteroidales bacterium]
MEFNQSLKLKEQWGNKPCDHPKVEKVYYAGAFVLNYSCILCGTDFTVAEKLELEQMRKKQGQQTSQVH